MGLRKISVEKAPREEYRAETDFRWNRKHNPEQETGNKTQLLFERIRRSVIWHKRSEERIKKTDATTNYTMHFHSQ